MNKMKYFSKGVVLVAALISGQAVNAAGSTTANLGFMSDYFFRGAFVTDSTISGGMDHDFGNGFAVGTWLADIDNGLEYDLYGSYSGSFNKEFNYSVALNTYNYTDADNLDTVELDFKLGYGPIEVEYATGTIDDNAGDIDYNFLGVTLNYKDAYLTLGNYGNDLEGSYFELGYNVSFSALDATFAIINNDDDIEAFSCRSADCDGETAVTLTVTKTFDVKF